MRAFRLTYDGAPFHGFQRQPDVPTVEDAVFRALARLDLHDPADGKPPGYSAAGRTDARVSAVAQTVAFECPDWCSPSALNAELPDEIQAWASADAPSDFHAGIDARRREYVYHLHAPDVDDDRLGDAADRLAGQHDFHNLTPDDEGTVRAVAIEVERDGDFVTLVISAGGFPRQLVRRLVALLADVGSGERSLASIDRVLAPEELPGPVGIPPAPAHPLVLSAVEYDVAFAPDPDASAGARRAFASTRDEHLARARVAGSIVERLSGSSVERP